MEPAGWQPSVCRLLVIAVRPYLPTGITAVGCIERLREKREGEERKAKARERASPVPHTCCVTEDPELLKDEKRTITLRRPPWAWLLA